MTGTSLIATMAAKRGMDPAQFARTIRSTVMPSDHTEEQFAAFMLVADRYGLDPIAKEIYAYPARKGGGITPVLAVDGWIHLVNAHPENDGFEISFDSDENGKLRSATCTMWRKDRNHPTVVTEYLSETYRNTDPWNQMPRRMLRHKAFKECARLAFGFAGIVDEDEARDIDRAVTRLERPTAAPQMRVVDSLDHFAAEAQTRAGEAAVPPETGKQTAQSFDIMTGEIFDSLPDAQTVRDDGWQDAITRILTMVTDPQVPQQGRLENLDQMRPVYEDALPIEKVKVLFDRALKVARGEEKSEHARRYLEAL